jgi:hypothetical protein
MGIAFSGSNSSNGGLVTPHGGPGSYGFGAGGNGSNCHGGTVTFPNTAAANTGGGGGGGGGGATGGAGASGYCLISWIA